MKRNKENNRKKINSNGKMAPVQLVAQRKSLGGV